MLLAQDERYQIGFPNAIGRTDRQHQPGHRSGRWHRRRVHPDAAFDLPDCGHRRITFEANSATDDKAIYRLIERAIEKKRLPMSIVTDVEQHAIKSIESAHESAMPEIDELLLRTLKQMQKDKPWGVTAGEVLRVAKETESALLAKYRERGVGAVFNRYGIRSRPRGGRKYFNPDKKQ